MIKDLDASMKKLLVGEATAGSELAKATLSCAVPDPDWRKGQTGLVLNVYLFRILEDRELRQNSFRPQRNRDGTISQSQFPTRLQCFYLLTAWNFAHVVGGEEPELQEHRLLSQVLLTLFRNTTLPARYLQGSLATTQEIDLPIIAARSDDLGVADSDFWSGLTTPLRPSVSCQVTLSMNLGQAISGPMVTTVQTRYPGGDGLFSVGGAVRSRSTGAPVANAWVLLDAQRTLYVTDSEGRFQIDGVSSGSHSLTARAVGFGEAVRSITVPQPTGEYDLTLNP